MAPLTVACPSCAAPIALEERWTRLAVCPSCRSAVGFDDGLVELVGRLSVLPPSRTSLFVGAQGSIQGSPFKVLGRVRYGWERGYWDEWHLLWTDDGSTGWLSEDEERLVVETLAAPVSLSVTPDAELGSAVAIEGQTFSVIERGVGVVEGGEGQLPFRVVGGETTAFLTLRTSDGDRVASVEFGADGARLFVGVPVSLAEMDLPWTRQALGIEGDLPLAQAADGTVPRVQSLAEGVRPLRCCSCGGGLEVAALERGAFPSAVACAYCGAANSLSGKPFTCPNCQAAITTMAGDAKVAHCAACDHQVSLFGDAPSSLGAAGKATGASFSAGDRWDFDGVEYVVTGVLRMEGATSGEAWHYWEYCLFEESVGYRWLVHSDGRWILATRVFDHPPLTADATESELVFRGVSYPVVEDNVVTIGYVAGELPWVARRGDDVRVIDTSRVAGQSLSVEWGPDEVEWYLGRRVKVERAERVGRADTSDSDAPHGRWYRHVMWMLTLTLVGLSLWMFRGDVFGHERPDRGRGDIEPPALASAEGAAFSLDVSESPLALTFRAQGLDLQGGWAHYRATVSRAGSVVEGFTFTHEDFYMPDGQLRENLTTALLLDLDPGPYEVRVRVQTGLVDGTTTIVPTPSLSYEFEPGVRRSYLRALWPILVLLGLSWFCLGLYGAVLLSMESRRASAPRLPKATVLWALAIGLPIAWAFATPRVSREEGGPATTSAAPNHPVNPNYASLRAAVAAAAVARSIRSGSSSTTSSRSYSGGGYRSGK